MRCSPTWFAASSSTSASPPPWPKPKPPAPSPKKWSPSARRGTLHDRRLAAARLHQEDAVKILFAEIAPAQKERHGGYTRIVQLGQRQGDAGQKAILEWVDLPVAEAPAAPESGEASKPAEKPAETKAEPAAAK